MHVFIAVVVAVMKVGRRLRRTGCGRGRWNREREGGNGVVVVIGGVRVSVGGLPVLAVLMTMRMAVILVGMIMAVVMLSMRMVVFIVGVVMATMGVAVFPSMVVASMAKSIHSDQVNDEAEATDGQ